MSVPSDPNERAARLEELFADSALVGLAPHEHTELAELLLATGRTPRSAGEVSWDRAAAAVAMLGVAARREQMPAHLFGRIEQRALEATGLSKIGAGMTPPNNVASLAERRASRVPLVLGWLAAAACFLLAIGAYVMRPREVVVTKTVVVPASASMTAPAPSAPPSPKAEREALLARSGSVQTEWSATKDPASKEAGGDVVWNATEQKGFMRFHGLAKNDPKVSQYQLWIFDKTRDQKYPVDGGVFDVDGQTGDVIVPIQARVPVGDATLFAITVEKPGGVVVSKRERIVLTAKTS
jgi:hypothetical protein